MKIWFCDFWPNFCGEYFRKAISLAIGQEVTLNPKPDILFYSVFGSSHKQFRCKKVMYTGETRKSEGFNVSLSFDEDGASNVRLPLWVLYIDWFGQGYNEQKNPGYLIPYDNLTSRKLGSREKFCNFIYNNNSGPRVEFFDKLSAYSTIDSPGALCNNQPHLGGNEKHKIDFQSRCKFSISFENTYYHGYVTEKILHPFAAGSLPVYWGSDVVKRDFNPKSFIYAGDFESLDSLVSHVKLVNENNDLFMSYMKEPCFANNSIAEEFLPVSIGKKIVGRL